MLFDSQQMTQRTGSVYSMSSVPGGNCSMMEGIITAKTIEANEIQHVIISSLRMNDWETDQFCQARYRIVPFRIGSNLLGSIFECHLQFVPSIKLKMLDTKLRSFWKKALMGDAVDSGTVRKT
jgi:hypothetical protein